MMGNFLGRFHTKTNCEVDVAVCKESCSGDENELELFGPRSHFDDLLFESFLVFLS